ncbi:MAG: hypothetical protein ACREBS_01765 [Nitrososphaerales archaeon]
MRQRRWMSYDLAKTIFSASAALLLSWLLLVRAIPEFESFSSEVALLKVEAKCPGLPYGQDSSGPDYINIVIDVGLAVVAVLFVYLSIRDFRRRKNLAAAGDAEGPKGEDE